MEVLNSEADKGASSEVKEYINTMNEADKLAFENAINAMESGDNKNTLAKLFGITLD
jgi:hypothetical protein